MIQFTKKYSDYLQKLGIVRTGNAVDDSILGEKWLMGFLIDGQLKPSKETVLFRIRAMHHGVQKRILRICTMLFSIAW